MMLGAAWPKTSCEMTSRSKKDSDLGYVHEDLAQVASIFNNHFYVLLVL